VTGRRVAAYIASRALETNARWVAAGRDPDTTDPISDLAPLTQELGLSFDPNYDPSPSNWAQAHLINGSCP
jgi:hypothetical protein